MEASPPPGSGAAPTEARGAASPGAVRSRTAAQARGSRMSPGGPNRRILVPGSAGPWTHTPWQRTSNGFDFGEHAGSPIDEAQVEFFRR